MTASIYFVLIGSALIYYAKRSEEKQQRTFTNIPEPFKIESWAIKWNGDMATPGIA